ncbi:unnamed protein product, partial [Ectocarpus sp. 4 AP-2014]
RSNLLLGAWEKGLVVRVPDGGPVRHTDSQPCNSPQCTFVSGRIGQPMTRLWAIGAILLCALSTPISAEQRYDMPFLQ